MFFLYGSAFCFSNGDFITSSLWCLSSRARTDLLQSKLTDVVLAYLSNCPQDDPALQILFMSFLPQSVHQPAL